MQSELHTGKEIMFTLFVQYIDLIKLHTIGLFFIFFVLSWLIYIIKLVKASRFKPYKSTGFSPTLSVVIPVVDEDMNIWRRVLESIKEAVAGLNAQVMVIPNGKNSTREEQLAKDLGMETYRMPKMGKREAIQEAVKHLTGEITIILDSDTIVEPNAITELVQPFYWVNVGGATPRHKIFDRTKSVFRRVSDWLEDIRFNEVVKGQNKAISCLPGRLLAIRTNILKESVDCLVNQNFLGKPCISGDDRYLTSCILEAGYETAYVPSSIVYTDAPNSLDRFVKQRLRWSRTSLRETIRSLKWLFRYPFTAFTVLSTIIMRWFFFTVIVVAILDWVSIIERPHYLVIDPFRLMAGVAVGFLLSGCLRHFRHLVNYPGDLPFLPVFLLVTTFILTPVEWVGNLSLRESGWMTRKDIPHEKENN